MATKRDPKQSIVESVLEDVKGHLGGDSTALLDRFAVAGADRAQRLEVSRLRIAEALGDDHPRVLRLQRRADLVAGVTGRVEAAKVRVDSTPELRAHEWLAYGKVIGESDEPLAGLRVTILDKDREQDDLLGDEITDAAGEFRAIYHARDFLDEDKSVPDLYIMVSDSSGKVLFLSERTVQPSEGRADYFQIILTGERLEKGVPRSQCKARTSKGSQCKNLGAPGRDLCARHRAQA